ncbi:hypothetical protein [Rickettsia endosymbiont of Polydrusus tereticollis]|uniref:hypothetical protein n=1 Tax=Rickettsia endosymbiont of Polydrusus tereticollis TaxID=3066251 RepID=UPI00313352C8
MRKSILKYSLYEVKITTNNIAILRLFPSLVVKNCNNLITTFSLSTVMGLTGFVAWIEKSAVCHSS